MKALLHIIIYIGVIAALVSCDSIGRGNRMRALLTDATERNAKALKLPTEDSLQMLIDYFDSHGSANECMQAMYLMGCMMYYDYGDAPTALKWYHNAMNAADTTDSQCDFHTLSRVYGQMARLFHYQRTPQIELEMYTKAEQAAWKAKDTLTAIIYHELRLSAYSLMKMPDSVISIHKSAARLYKKYGYEKHASKNLLPLIYAYINNKGDYKIAKSLMDRYEKESERFARDGSAKAGYEGYYYVKGLYNEGVGNIDSALYYYRRVLLYPGHIDNLLDGYHGLMSVYCKQNLPDSVNKYANLYCLMNDSISIKKSSEEIVWLHTMYYKERSQIAELQSYQQRQQYNLVFFIICFTTSLIIAMGIWYYRRLKKKNTIKLTETNIQYNNAVEQLDTLTQDLKLMSGDYNQYKKKMETERNRLLDLISSHHMADVPLDMSERPSYIKQLHKQAMTGKEATRSQLDALKKYAEKQYAVFVGFITEPTYKLSDIDIWICLLIKAGFIPSEISILLNISSQVLTNHKSKINMRLYKTASARLLDSNICGKSEHNS